jgi:hypothetical protein
VESGGGKTKRRDGTTPPLPPLAKRRKGVHITQLPLWQQPHVLADRLLDQSLRPQLSTGCPLLMLWHLSPNQHQAKGLHPTH